MSDDTEQIAVFIAHHLCDIAEAIALPVFALLYLFYGLAAGPCYIDPNPDFLYPAGDLSDPLG